MPLFAGEIEVFFGDKDIIRVDEVAGDGGVRFWLIEIEMNNGS